MVFRCEGSVGIPDYIIFVKVGKWVLCNNNIISFNQYGHNIEFEMICGGFAYQNI